jgi:hypothetical protein
MTSRLSRRRNLVIIGCVFAAVISGIACTGVVHASGCEITVSAAGDGPVISSSDWIWEASDGSLFTVPAGPGQEVIRGGYSGSVVSSGPANVGFSRTLESGDAPRFTTCQEIQAAGPGLYQESISVDSCGSSGGGVSCAASDTMTSLNRSAYCEHSVVSVVLITNGLHYSSEGAVSQGAVENPDSLAFRSSAEGSGSGTIVAMAGSMNGIGTEPDPGYRQYFREEVSVSGRIRLNGSVLWASQNNAGNPG